MHNVKSVCVCVRVCVRACVRPFVVRVRECVCARVYVTQVISSDVFLVRHEQQSCIINLASIYCQANHAIK